MPTIQQLNTIQQLQDYRSSKKYHKIGLVPTMGNLHDGHLALVEETAKHCDEIIVSIFVNPAQFAPEEDFDTYPRTLEKDIEALSQTACTAVFTPTMEDIYPKGSSNLYDLHDYPDIEKLSKPLCGKSRPHFFYGVVKVVGRLFEIMQSDYACFGEKDYQQLLIVSKISQRFFPSLTILPIPIQRNQDHLALSSRNKYLSDEQLKSASFLPNQMQKVADLLSLNSLPHQIRGEWRAILKQATQALEQYFTIDYFEIRQADDLQLVASANEVNQSIVDDLDIKNTRLFAAVHYENIRLIDNWTLKSN